MRKFTLPFGLFFVACAVVFVVAILQFFTREVVVAYTKVDEKVCVGVSVEKPGDHYKLNLDCSGRKAYTHDAEAILAYVNTKSPLSCEFYKHDSDRAYCRVPEKK